MERNELSSGAAAFEASVQTPLLSISDLGCELAEGKKNAIIPIVVMLAFPSKCPDTTTLTLQTM